MSIFVKRFLPGRGSFLAPGTEKKWYSTYTDRPGGEWDRVAALMMIKFGESGHPVFRATSPLSRGTLKSKGGGKLSIHFWADGDTIETVLRTIILVNQLSIHGAVSDLCEEFSSCQTVRLVVADQSDSHLAPADLLVTRPTPSIDAGTRKSVAEAMGSRLPRRIVGCSNFITNARQLQAGNELGLSPLSWQQVTFSLSRKGASFQHNWFNHVVLSRHCSFAVVVDFVCMLRCTRPQTHRCIRLVQETLNTSFSSANTLFDKTVRVRIIGSGRGVKDCVCCQPVADCAHDSRPSSLWKSQTPRNSNCMSTIASLIVSLRLLITL